VHEFRKVLLFLFLSVFLISGCVLRHKKDVNISTLISSREREDNEHILFGYPSTEGTILYRQGYVLCHDNKKKVAD